ncbi:1-acyl-sn-glycerol-3-phosphate acyltransferase [Novosphingobium sp.]|uniref:1-acyl-sn-glycerol-3-phosphate acyltransferase n=1 Tax=Novosphingobium sp. TaxID=1874826 RepID=UPI00286A9F6D|nr:1-acyl-sn-glycerol-3-phosphate acyltransferase [Novosphingobium sp.]
MRTAGPSLLSRLVRRLIIALYRWRGYRLEDNYPAPRRCVIIGVPHTTNWDFVFFLGATAEAGIRPSFMGKHTLFAWPMTRFMYDMGGVSVDRSAKGRNYVDQVVDAFAGAEELALVVAPEGTRSASKPWRSGFYHIANKAGVALVPAWVEDKTRRGGIGPAIMPSGDYAGDLAKLLAYYRSVMPGHPRWALLEAAITEERSEAHA